jgi:predicted amidohydrolase
MGFGFPSAITSTWTKAFLISQQGNLERILLSIAIAKERGARLRVGPELEIPYVKLFHSARG